jgi:hypothetical protein
LRYLFRFVPGALFLLLLLLLLRQLILLLLLRAPTPPRPPLGGGKVPKKIHEGQDAGVVRVSAWSGCRSVGGDLPSF